MIKLTFHWDGDEGGADKADAEALLEISGITALDFLDDIASEIGRLRGCIDVEGGVFKR